MLESQKDMTVRFTPGRARWLLWVGTLSGATLILAAVLYTFPTAPSFRLTALDPPRKSLNFALLDQFGRRVSLAGFRGQVAVLTFLYTSCPDVCPLVTQKLRETRALLGERAARVAFLVVTVDPERDTVRRIRDYSSRFDMLEQWRFLTGSRAELEPVWEYYWVGKVWTDERGNVMHEAPVHLIDRQGRVRAVSGQAFRPAELAHDIEGLLKS